MYVCLCALCLSVCLMFVCVPVSLVCECVPVFVLVYSEDQWLGQFYSIHVTLISTGANLCVGACFPVCVYYG